MAVDIWGAFSRQSWVSFWHWAGLRCVNSAMAMITATLLLTA